METEVAVARLPVVLLRHTVLRCADFKAVLIAQFVQNLDGQKAPVKRRGK